VDTNRLIFQNNDLSVSNGQPSAISGYTVIKASKGITKPIYVQAQDTGTLLDLFGAPTQVINGLTYSYPGVQEAIDFITNGYGLFISAPAGNHTGSTSNFGGVYMTTAGSFEPFMSSVSELGSGDPSIDYNILCSITAPSSAYTSGFTPIAGGSPFSTGNSAAPTIVVKFQSGVGITIDNIPNIYFNTANVASITLASVGSVPFSYTLGYNGGGYKFIVSPGIFGTNTIGTVSTGTLGSTYTKITFLAPPADPNCPLITSASLVTTIAGSTSLTTSWVNMIQSQVIISFYQSSMRAMPGVLTVSNLLTMNTPVNISLPACIPSITQSLTNANTLVLTVPSFTGPVTTQYLTIGTFNPIPVNTADTPTTMGVAIAAMFNANAPGFTATPVAGVITIAGTTAVDYASWANPSYNTVNLTYTEMQYGSNPAQTGITGLTISTDQNAVNAAGSSIYFNNLIATNNYLRAWPNLQFTGTAAEITWPTSVSNTLIGSRILSSGAYSNATDLSATLQPGWDYITNEAYADVMVAFEPEYATTLTGSLAGYRANAMKFTTFIQSVRIPNGIPLTNSDNNAAVLAYIAARSTLPNVTGLAYYCNEMYMQDMTGSKYYGTPLGSVAAMLALIMDKAQGGRAPMFTNDSQGFGGQINKTVIKQKFIFTATHLDQLDAAGINPIINDIGFGVMVTSQRTAQSPSNLTDWSYLGHSMSFDLFRKEMRNTVMFPQLGKPISGTYIQLRTDQSNIILGKRKSGSNAIWADGKIFIAEVNTPATKAQNIFMIKARVQVIPFADYVELIFENIGQTMTV